MMMMMMMMMKNDDDVAGDDVDVPVGTALFCELFHRLASTICCRLSLKFVFDSGPNQSKLGETYGLT